MKRFDRAGGVLTRSAAPLGAPASCRPGGKGTKSPFSKTPSVYAWASPTSRLEAGAPSTIEVVPIRRNMAQRHRHFVVTAIVPTYPCAGDRLRPYLTETESFTETDPRLCR